MWVIGKDLLIFAKTPAPDRATNRQQTSSRPRTSSPRGSKTTTNTSGMPASVPSSLRILSWRSRTPHDRTEGESRRRPLELPPNQPGLGGTGQQIDTQVQVTHSRRFGADEYESIRKVPSREFIRKVAYAALGAASRAMKLTSANLWFHRSSRQCGGRVLKGMAPMPKT